MRYNFKKTNILLKIDKYMTKKRPTLKKTTTTDM